MVVTRSFIRSLGATVYKRCGEYLVTLRETPHTRSNKGRKDIVDLQHAKIRGSEYYVEKIEHILHGVIVVSIDNTIYEYEMVKYIVGDIVRPRCYNEDENIVCGGGIHVFYDKITAEQFGSQLIFDGLHREYYDNGLVRKEFTVKDGKAQGILQTWYPNGVLGERMVYVDGVRHGRYETWYENGAPLEACVYSHNMVCGKYVRWHPNGRVMEEYNMIDGVCVGLYTEYWENGKKKRETTYRENGMYFGLYKEWYENGQLACSFNYDTYGNIDGKYQSWHENGKLRNEYVCVRGWCHGEDVMYDSTGKEIKRSIWDHGLFVSGTP